MSDIVTDPPAAPEDDVSPPEPPRPNLPPAPMLLAPAGALPVPLEIRLQSVTLGEAMGHVPLHDLEVNGSFFGDWAARVAAIRANAERAVAEREIGREQESARTVQEAVETETTEGARAQSEAERLGAELPRFQDDVRSCTVEEENATADVVRLREALASARDRLREAKVRVATAAKDTPKPTLVEMIALDPAKLGALFSIEVGVSLFQLEPSVSDVLKSTSWVTPFVVASTLALVLQAAFFVVGRMIAVVELPRRVVAAIGVLAFAIAITRLVPQLDLLRTGDEEGLKALTTGSLLAGFVAAATGWAGVIASTARAGVDHDLLVVRAEVDRESDRVSAAEADVQRGEQRLADAQATLTEARQALSRERDRIAACWAIADATDKRSAQRRLNGAQAAVRIESIQTTSDILVESEMQHGDLATQIARSAWLRFQELEAEPEEGSSSDDTVPFAAVQAALAALAAGAVGGAALSSPLVFAGGAAIAAAAFGAGLLWPKRRQPAPALFPGGPDGLLPIRDSNWKRQPDVVDRDGDSSE